MALERRYFLFFKLKNITGGYLWAPQYGDNGRHCLHWDRIIDVRKGDLIIYSIMQKIIANEEVYASNRPTELPDQWNHEGWRVDTKYHIIQNPIKTTEHMGKILELQPQENAPFNKIGKVNTGYLFFATKEMAANIIKKTAVTQAIDVEKTVLSDLADPEEQYNPATKGKSQPLYKQWEEGLSKR